MARTLTQLEVALSKLIPREYLTGSASADGAADGTTVVTTANDLLMRRGESWERFIIEPTSGAADGELREIDDVSVTSGVMTLTVVNAFTAQIANSVTFRVHRLPLQWKYDAIDEALARIADILPRQVVEEFLSGELLANSRLEQWRADTPYDWTIVAGTVTRETTTKYQGDSALKLVGSSSSVRQRIPLEWEASALTLSLTGWVQGKIANAPGLRITFGNTDNDSPTVAADDTWEQLTVTAAITDSTQPIYVSLINDHADQGAYFDALHLVIQDRASVYVIPISKAFRSLDQLWHRGPISTEFMASEVDWAMWPFSDSLRIPEIRFAQYGRWPYRVAVDKPLRLVGKGLWPTLTASTDSVDISLDDEPLVLVRAGLRLMDKAMAANYMTDNDHWQEIKTRLLEEENRLMASIHRAPDPVHLNIPLRR